MINFNSIFTDTVVDFHEVNVNECKEAFKSLPLRLFPSNIGADWDSDKKVRTLIFVVRMELTYFRYLNKLFFHDYVTDLYIKKSAKSLVIVKCFVLFEIF